MGTKKKNYRELAQEIELYTGGISVTTSLVTNHSNIFSSEGHIYISTMALERNIPKMFDILQEIITLPIFNNPDLLRTYIYEKTSNFQESLINNGHVFAMSQSSSPFTRSYMLSELWGGISQASFMQSLAQQEDLSFVIEKLQKIASLLLDKAISRCLVTTEEKYFSQTEKYLNYFMDSLPNNPMKDKNIGEIKEFPNEKKKIYITLPGLQVHHIASSFLTIPYTHPDSPKLKLLSRLVSSCFLHPEIREKGGAYGSGALDNSGIFSFYSYRDPHIYKTLNIFSQTFKWLKENNFTEQDIEEAKLSLFSDIDIPIAPSAKGVSEFTTGITYEMREEQRKKLFSITRKDLLDVGEKYLSQEQNSITVLGPEPSLTFKEKNPNWVYWSDIINSSL
jgi:Zn-dependent M16 (insulinase) family peptidase